MLHSNEILRRHQFDPWLQAMSSQLPLPTLPPRPKHTKEISLSRILELLLRAVHLLLRWILLVLFLLLRVSVFLHSRCPQIKKRKSFPVEKGEVLSKLGEIGEIELFLLLTLVNLMLVYIAAITMSKYRSIPSWLGKSRSVCSRTKYYSFWK